MLCLGTWAWSSGLELGARAWNLGLELGALPWNLGLELGALSWILGLGSFRSKHFPRFRLYLGLNR